VGGVALCSTLYCDALLDVWTCAAVRNLESGVRKMENERVCGVDQWVCLVSQSVRASLSVSQSEQSRLSKSAVWTAPLMDFDEPP
jgi:hypothetical protein